MRLVGYLFEHEPDPDSGMIYVQIIAGIIGGIASGIGIFSGLSALDWNSTLIMILSIVGGLISGILIGCLLLVLIGLVICLVILAAVLAGIALAGYFVWISITTPSSDYAVLKAPTALYAKIDGKQLIETSDPGTVLRIDSRHGRKFTTWFKVNELKKDVIVKGYIRVPDKVYMRTDNPVFAYDSVSQLWKAYSVGIVRKNKAIYGGLVNKFFVEAAVYRIDSTSDNVKKEEVLQDKGLKVIRKGFFDRYKSDDKGTIYYCAVDDYRSISKLCEKYKKLWKSNKLKEYPIKK